MAWKVSGFEPVGRLGSGATGSVVKARDTDSGTHVAIKYLSRDVSGNPGFSDKFQSDGAKLTRIDSPHVAQVYGHVDEGHGPATVTEFVDGASLRSILARGGLEPQAALYVVKGALTGLAEAHRRGVVHGDVTPGNLIIDRSGLAKVVDFGIAARYRSNAPAAGNPVYLAPELWVERPATPASDVFAATVILLEALTGAAPKSAHGGFIGNAGLAASDNPVVAPPAGLPDRVRALITRGLAPQSSARFANAEAMADALVFAAVGAYGFDWENVGRRQLVARMAAPAETGSAGPPPAGRRRIRILTAVACVIILGAAAYVVASGVFRTPATTHHAAGASTGPTPLPTPTGATPTQGSGSTLPQQPAGLHVTSRSQTAVSLDWSPAQDNAQVIGYIVLQNNQRIATIYAPGYTVGHLRPGTTYQFSVIAFDSAKNLSPASSIVVVATLTVPDTQPPTVPTGLHSTGQTPSMIVLAWSPARDNVGVVGYAILRNGKQIAVATGVDFTDTGLTAATTYHYTVRAYDTTGNASHVSSPVAVSTLAGPDRTAPTPPHHVKATSTGPSTVHVVWSTGTDNIGVTGYQVFRDGVEIATSTAQRYDDYGLTAATSYQYTVESLDAAGNPSAMSSAATVTTDPLPQPTPTPTPTDTTTEPPPPPAAVTGITLEAAAVSTTTCTTTLTATITASGGLYSADVIFAVAGQPTQTTTVIFDVNGIATATLSAVDGDTDGTATATVVGTVYSADTAWTAPSECPLQPSPSPSPTDTSDIVATPGP